MTELKELLSNGTQLNLDEIEKMEENDILRFESRTGLKVQLLAAERGHESAIKSLINRGFDINCEVDGNSPIDVAFANKHFNVVHNLLRANSRFPKEFDHENAPEDLKRFSYTTKLFHESIEKDDEEKICEIIKENPGVKYFYSLENKSAVRIALENKKIELYKLLITQKVYIGPNEEMFMIVRSLGRKFRRQLRELHLELSTCIISKPMIAIAKNCFIGPDVPDQEEKYNFVHEALRYLFNIPSVAKYLEIVAASREFRIVFDFNRDCVDFLDPTSEPYANGLFYPSGKIYIGARDMLDPLKKFEVYAVMAHELCHYAMFLVYENNGKPYYENDQGASKMLDLIVAACRGWNEDVIRTLFDCYPKDYYHAEVIVRAPQLLVLYNETPEVLEQEEFKPLLNYYESEVVPEIENSLDKVKAKYLSENEKKIKKQQKIIFSLSTALIFLILLSIPLGLWLYTPVYSWKTMTEQEKLNIKRSIVSYRGTEVQFGKLFRNESIFKNLKSESIRLALNGNTKLLTDQVNSLFDNFVYLEWNHMTDELRSKFIDSNVIFQGSNVKMSKILETDSPALSSLSPDQIGKALRGNGFSISTKIEQKTKFFYERHFVNEKYDYDEPLKNIRTEISTLIDGNINETFYNDLHSIITQNQIKSSDDILQEVESSHIFLLSSYAGEGKSTSFRHFWFKLKEKHPEKWIEYIDLKQHISAFDTGKNSNLTDKNALAHFLANTLLKLEEFEKELFLELFQSNKVVFLWDGIDEISPYFTEFMLDLVVNIKALTLNDQFVSTRPQHSKTYREKLKIVAHKLLVLQPDERFEFLVLCLVNQYDLNITFNEPFVIKQESFIDSLKASGNYSESVILKLDQSLKNGENIFQKIEASVGKNLIRNPLLVLMVAEIVTNDNSSSSETVSFYQLYETFIDKKLKISSQKGDIVDKDLRKIKANPSLGIMQVHQVYAIKLLWPELNNETAKLKISKSLNGVTPLEISRFGILSVESNGNFEFIHRTFAEFFVAQFLVYNIHFLENTGLKFFHLLKETLYDSTSDVIKKFLISCAESSDLMTDTLEYIKHYKKLDETLSDSNLKSLIKFTNFASFLELQEVLDDVEKVNIDPLNVKEDDCVKFTEIWDNLLSQLQKSVMQKIFHISDELGNTFMHRSFQHCSNYSNNELLLKINEAFGGDHIFEITSRKNKDGTNPVLFSAKFHKFSSIWPILEKFFDSKKRQALIESENQNSHGILEYSAYSYNENSSNENEFAFARTVFLSILPKHKIQDFLLRESSRGLKPFPFYAVLSTVESQKSSLICEHLVKLTEEAFEGNKIKIENLLISKSSNGKTLLKYFTGIDVRNIRACLKKLQKLTVRSNHENLILYTHIASEAKNNLALNDKGENAFDTFVVNEETCTNLITIWDKSITELGVDKFQNIFQVYDELGNTFLHRSFQKCSNESNNEILAKLSETYGNDKVFEMVSRRNKHGSNPVLVSARYHTFSKIWPIIKNLFDAEKQAKLLTSENENSHGILEHSAYYGEIVSNENDFVYATSLFISIVPKQKIQNFLLRENSKKLKPFLFYSVFNALTQQSARLCEDLIKFTEEAFESNMTRIDAFLKTQSSNGKTIFNYFPEDENIKKQECLNKLQVLLKN